MLRQLAITFSINFLFGISVFAQIAGDVTGDHIIDATDYMELHQIISGEKKATFISDINKDGETNVADLLILENYIYREGQAPQHEGKKESKTELTLTPGLVDPNEKSIEIVMENSDAIAAFQLEFSGIESIRSISGGLLEKSGMKFSFEGRRLYAILDNGNEIAEGKNVLFKMTFEGDFEEICIVKPVFCNYNSERFVSHIGQCANKTYTKDGCEVLKEVILGQAEPDRFSDVNKDGYVTISDLQIVENFLYRNGPPPPGDDVSTKNKVKLNFQNVDNHNRTVEVGFTSKESIAGFRFSLEGISGIQVNGGVAHDNDMELHIEGNSIIALTGDGSIIPPGKGALLKVNYEDTLASELCFFNPLFISPNATNFNMQLGECKSLVPIIEGCMDSLALNYNPKANRDDGSCEYPPPPPKPPKPPKEKKPKPEKKKKEEKEKIEEESLAENDQPEKEPKQKKSKKEKEPKKEEQETSEERRKEPKENKKKKETGEEETKKSKEEAKKEEKKKSKENPKKKKEEKVEKKKEELKIPETDLAEVDEAVLVPKVTSVERMNIPNPKKGQMVYDTDANAFIYYDGKTWRVVGNGDKQVSGFDVKRKGKKWLMKKSKKE